MPMQPITVGRLESDPEAQGVIRPADNRWQLVIDKDGYPHLYVEVKFREGGELITGMFAVEDMLIEQMTVRDLMDGGEFGEPLKPEEEAGAAEWYEKFREGRPIPCPRP